MTRRVLVLGGTAEARALAAELAARGLDVTTSLAGRTRHPRLPAGEVRTGGFGGVAGLAEALADVDVLVDATHPFAATMTEHAAAAASLAGTPLIVLRRPGWTEGPGDRWTRVPSSTAAAAAIPVRRAGAARDRPPGRRGVRRRRRVVPRARDRGACGAASARRAPAGPRPLRPRRRARPARPARDHGRRRQGLRRRHGGQARRGPRAVAAGGARRPPAPAGRA